MKTHKPASRTPRAFLPALLAATLLLFPAFARGKASTLQEYKADNGTFKFTIDIAAAPDTADWTRDTLAPAIKEWYPKIVSLLYYPGYKAAANFSIVYIDSHTWKTNHQGTPLAGAAAQVSGLRMTVNAGMIGKSGTVGLIVHELVHVVQHGGGRLDKNRKANNDPVGWLVEGMAEYVHWFVYAPQKGVPVGADVTAKNINTARYDGGYRMSANFLNWVATNLDRNIIRHVFEAMNQGNYDDDLWKKWTGHTLQELNDEWKAGLRKQIFKD